MTNNIVGITYKYKSPNTEKYITSEHRDYIQKTNFNEDFWDSKEFPGYQGFIYDGRWKEVAEFIIKYFNLNNNSKILDIGCGKGYLLYEIHKLLPDADVKGIDISEYAIKNAKEEIKPHLSCSSSTQLSFKDHYFDFVFSLNVIYFMSEEDSKKTVQEIERVKKKDAKSIIQVASYNNEEEKQNMLNWDLGVLYKSIPEWEIFFKESNYNGEYSFVIHK